MVMKTNRHFRMFMRAICPHETLVLWTEMTWDRSLLYNSPGEPEYALNKDPRPIEHLVGFSADEHPVVLQLAGAEPEMLARAARIGAARGYDEINLNCGCPAQMAGRARNCYGARLMNEPERVARCCAAMAAAVDIPVTVKIRLGVDSRDSYGELCDFVRTVASVGGVRHFYVHARKAILGLDTVKNRSVPPLRHDWVFRLARDFPDLYFTINGGVKTLGDAARLMRQGAHGVMIGRQALAEPYAFALAATAAAAGVGTDAPAIVSSRREALQRYSEYLRSGVESQNRHSQNRPELVARMMLTPLVHLFHGTAANKSWKQLVSPQISGGNGSAAPSDLVDSWIATMHSELGEELVDALLDERPQLVLDASVSG